ncbi:MAG: DUF6912 family protein [Actinomycetes bacterium]
MTARVYVPTTWSGLRQVVTADGLGPAPFFGHAVTRGLRAAWPEGDDEELEYAATTAAARTALGLLTEEDPPRRVVLAVDAGTVVEAAGEDPTVVEVGEVVPMRLVAAVLVDTEDAAADVVAARAAWAPALEGDTGAEAVVERCLDRDLAWFAVQEVGELLTWE